MCVCGWVFVHGRMNLDGNKLKKVFQDGVSKSLLSDNDDERHVDGGVD